MNLLKMNCEFYKNYCQNILHGEDCHEVMAKYYGKKVNGNLLFYFILLIII